MFDYVQQFNNSPAYRQRHSVAGKLPNYLYRDDGGDWRVGDKLGDSSSYLKNRTMSEFVPTNNWQYDDYDGWNWQFPDGNSNIGVWLDGDIRVTHQH